MFSYSVFVTEHARRFLAARHWQASSFHSDHVTMWPLNSNACCVGRVGGPGRVLWNFFKACFLNSVGPAAVPIHSHPLTYRLLFHHSRSVSCSTAWSPRCNTCRQRWEDPAPAGSLPSLLPAPVCTDLCKETEVREPGQCCAVLTQRGQRPSRAGQGGNRHSIKINTKAPVFLHLLRLLADILIDSKTFSNTKEYM